MSQKYRRLNVKLLIFIAVCNYLDADKVDLIKKDLARRQQWPDALFIKMLAKYFDFETLRISPLISEDIWLYNYLSCDCILDKQFKFVQKHFTEVPITFKRSKLINRYEKQIIMPQLLALKDAEALIRLTDK